MGSSAGVREPAVAGSFYPGTKEALEDAVSSMLMAAQPTAIDGKLIGLISPHAGYMYSGGVAAHGYRAVKGKHYEAVIIIAPSHHVYLEGSSIYSIGPYRTPIGLVEVDRQLAQAIMESEASISFRPEAHLREHSLEVQLPFLQMVIPDLKIVPIIMGDQSIENCRSLATAIAANVKGREVLLVASSDLSHFHPYDDARELDGVVIEHVKNYDPEGLSRALGSRKCEACGGGPMITVMLASKEMGANSTAILKYANSGDVTGDRSNVVGYLSAAILARESVGVDLGLGHEEKTELLRLARQSIEAQLLGRPMPDRDTDSPSLQEKAGAFVTLTRHGQLRGCIGHIRGVEPLYTTVSKMAVAAAVEDPRFQPMTADELGEISIEISVLTPLKKTADPDKITVGRDGIYIEKGLNRGLLLPQVAVEHGWERYEFLDHTCLKAGLPKGSWREGADIYTFSAQIFSEDEIMSKPSSQE
jgi:AmmeMemoRadiSam system protein B/AmmeMemoRadiSam system protein A